MKFLLSAVEHRFETWDVFVEIRHSLRDRAASVVLNFRDFLSSLVQ